MSRSLVWFRRDLRDFDHAALYHALKSTSAVYCVFVFDKNILDLLTDKQDRRVSFIWDSIRELKTSLQMQGGDLIVLYGDAVEEVTRLAQQLKVNAVYSNRDYEPSAIERDATVASALAQIGIAFYQYKDQVLFEQNEILTQAGRPYGVFTAYKNAYKKQLNDFYLQSYAVKPYLKNLAQVELTELVSLEMIGFARAPIAQLPTGMSGGEALFHDFVTRISHYDEARNYPAVKGVSYLSTHLRFGTVSVRELARTAINIGGAGAETWLNELIWRDFYFQVLFHRSDLAEGRAYKAEFDQIKFPNDKALFNAWCQGRTGYPLVDAAMRQLNQTGYMHNRLRMLTASFLVKDLLVDWRWGERYFAEKLIDFDFSANNGGWQWAASTGCDAQPYFRIFNPVTQSRKFDVKGKFIRKYVPELSDLSDKDIHAPWESVAFKQHGLNAGYIEPIVSHAQVRLKALALYKNP
ncbi:MAG: deoxyribodipyrimidine photo-lyase [Methylophilus sp.]|jgi:deoxyribodipyrimidine photo-lyase